MSTQHPSSQQEPSAPSEPKASLAVTEVLDAGNLSHAEAVRGRALGVARGTITDAELFSWFIEERAQSERTHQSYASQLRRLHWFCERRLGLASVRQLQREDWKTLRDYLAAPPDEDIMKGKSTSPSDAGWRPFRGPLSESSRSLAMTVIAQFMEWMASSSIGAIPRSPFGELKVPRKRINRTAVKVERYLNDSAMNWLAKALAEDPADAPGSDTDLLIFNRYKSRRAWIMQLGLLTGLRASELAAARSSMIQPDPEGGWVLKIVRKGAAESRLPLSEQMLAAWHRYRATQGIAEEADVPLIGRVDSLWPSQAARQPIKRQMLWHIVKQTCKRAADLATAAGDEHSAQSLLVCSTHWVRHTFAVQLLDSGADIRSAQFLLEHASLATTSAYLHIDEQRRRRDLEVMADRLTGRFRVLGADDDAGSGSSPS